MSHPCLRSSRRTVVTLLALLGLTPFGLRAQDAQGLEDAVAGGQAPLAARPLPLSFTGRRHLERRSGELASARIPAIVATPDRRMLLGILGGAAIGTSIGYWQGLESKRDHHSCGDLCGLWVLDPMIGGAIGGVTGAFIGYYWPVHDPDEEGEAAFREHIRVGLR